MPRGQIVRVVASPHEHFGRPSLQVGYGDLRVVESAGGCGDREEHRLPARQELRPEMIGLATLPVGFGEHGRITASG